MIVYLLTNRANGKHYIGQTIQPLRVRLAQHTVDARRKSGPLQTAIRKYGMDGFDAEILAEVENIDELNSLETLWILIAGATKRTIGYNCTSGGMNHRRSEETLAKMSASRRGRKQSPEAVARRVTAMRGKKRSGQALENIKAGARKREAAYTEEQRRYRSKRFCGVPTGRAPWNKGKKGVQVPWNKGKRATEEERLRLIDIRRNQVITPERRARISASLKGRMPAVNLRGK
jgi:group I intron endonuclease